MIDLFAHWLLALAHWLTAIVEPGVEQHSWLGVLKAMGIAFAASLLVMLAWFGARRRITSLAATTDDPLTPMDMAATVMRLLTPLAWLATATLVLAPTLAMPAAWWSRLWSGLLAGVVVVAAVALLMRTVWVVSATIVAWFRRRSAATPALWDDLLVELAWQVARTLIVVLGLYAATMLLVVPETLRASANRFMGLAVIAVIAWTLAALVRVGDRFLRQRFRIDVADNLRARRVHTQLVVMRRLAYGVIGLIALALALMQFESIRRVGTSILASAGLAGIVIGFAAQRTLANLLAGIQIALSQPLRIDDVVIFEGDFGRVEEITLTYVVVGTWDKRRWIIPLTHVIEHPFQDWTRTGSDLLGTVMLRCDFRVPVEAVRAEAKRLVEGDDRWNKQAFAVQVTEWSEHTVEVRVLLSAQDSGVLFGLRCAVREGLLAWLQREHPDSLPRLRVEPGGSPTDHEAPTQELPALDGPLGITGG